MVLGRGLVALYSNPVARLLPDTVPRQKSSVGHYITAPSRYLRALVVGSARPSTGEQPSDGTSVAGRFRPPGNDSPGRPVLGPATLRARVPVPSSVEGRVGRQIVRKPLT